MKVTLRTLWNPNDPTKLIPWEGEPLTVGGELNKLATNIGTGRNWAGIHWRSAAAGRLRALMLTRLLHYWPRRMPRGMAYRQSNARSR